jgi:hypothetical protein
MRTTSRRAPSRAQVSSVLLAVKAAVLGAVLALTVTAGVTASGTTAAPDARPPVVTMDASARVVQQVMSEHNCSSTGFAPGTQPDSALVRTSRGELRVVDFDRGWDVFTGRSPGLLVAVCLGRR